MTRAELLRKLAEAGHPVGSLAELRESRRAYPDAVPVLLAALRTTDDLPEREMIVRALSKRWAAPAAFAALVEEFRSAPRRWGSIGDNYAWAVGNALEIMAGDEHFEQLAALAVDPQYRRAREMVVLALGKSKRPEAVAVLLRLADDPDVDGHCSGSTTGDRLGYSRQIWRGYPS